LLQKAFVLYKDPLVFVFTPRSVDSFTAGGELVFSSFGFKIEDEALVMERYDLASFGAVVVTAN